MTASEQRQDDRSAPLTWRDGGIPVSQRFDDPYFSLQGGLDETRHVFLAGNGLPARYRPGFHIAELGFGTGLNLLATLLSLGTAEAHALRYTSFEAYPLPVADIARALAAFPEVQPVADPFLAAWATGTRQFDLGRIAVEIIEGDVRDTLPRWTGAADAWFLDGFSPAKNPAMWAPEVMTAVARHTAPGGTFATYTAAGHVRRALAEAGFSVTRQPGFGRKKHMTTGQLPAGSLA